MSEHIPERDWKYMRSVKDELLNDLAASSNRKSTAILESEVSTEIEKYHMLYKHVQTTDEIVAECFDDWRRSTLFFKILALRKHGLLDEEHFDNLTEETWSKIKMFEEVKR